MPLVGDGCVPKFSRDGGVHESRGIFLFADDSIPNVPQPNTGTKWDIPLHPCLAPEPSTALILDGKGDTTFDYVKRPGYKKTTMGTLELSWMPRKRTRQQGAVTVVM